MTKDKAEYQLAELRLKRRKLEAEGPGASLMLAVVESKMAELEVVLHELKTPYEKAMEQGIEIFSGRANKKR